MQLLIICTANRCRSPIAAALIERAVPLGPDEVCSRGLAGAGQTMPSLGVQLMADRGFDLSGHRSRPLTPEALFGADLVLGMERRHARRIVAWSAPLWARTFTLKDFVRRAELVGSSPPTRGAPGWLEEVGRGRRRTDLLDRPDANDEVRDPYGQSMPVWTSVVEELEELTRRLAFVWAPLTPRLPPRSQ
jgi:protein-tyrosine-phosphatase